MTFHAKRVHKSAKITLDFEFIMQFEPLLKYRANSHYKARDMIIFITGLHWNRNDQNEMFKHRPSKHRRSLINNLSLALK